MLKIKENFHLFYSKLKNSIKLCIDISPKLFFLKLSFILFTTPLPIIMTALWKLIIDDLFYIDNINIYSLGLLILSYCSIILVQSIVNHVYQYIDDMYNELRTIFVEKLQINMTSSFDLSFFDSSIKQSQFYELSSSFRDQTEMCWNLFNVISTIISFIISFFIIFSFNWWIALLTVTLTIPKLLYFKFDIKKRRSFRLAISEEARNMEYYRGVMSEAQTLTEIRSNKAEDFFEKNFIKRYKEIENKTSLFEMKSKSLLLLFTFVSYFSSIIIIIMSSNATLSGLITVGTIEYLWSNNTNLQNNTSSLIQQLTDITDKVKRIEELNDYCIENTKHEKRGGIETVVKHPKIEFENVTFSYPETNKKILCDCSFTIEPGEKIGLIGLNGSGKSTIVKLLLNMYSPDKGNILIDGIPADHYYPPNVRRCFSVVFQDTPTYVFLPVRDGIAISDYEKRNNDNLLNLACSKSGFDMVLKKKNADYETILNDPQCIRMENSMDFSGGEWQKLAMTRAYFRDAPIYVLDEPSASLDVFAEKDIFDQFGLLLKNKTIVLISHRLSNIVKCDKILVLEDGHIVEQGSHKELLKKNGKYAFLFNLQASKYK